MHDDEPLLVRFPDPSGRSLSQVVAAAPSGAVIEVAPGRYPGPLVVERSITLRVAGDLTHAQTAAALGCSEEASRQAQRDGLRTLRRTMEDDR